jgi:flavin-binding protein dodecin
MMEPVGDGSLSGRLASKGLNEGAIPVSHRTYRVTEVVGTSPEGVDDAIRNAVSRASRTLRHLDWFEVTQIRGQVVDNGVEHFQVGMKLGFRLEDDE